jgi:WD40 repeat protein
MASASYDVTVRVWDLAAADPNASPRLLKGHKGPVFQVAFAPDGKRLASASSDGTVRVWDLAAADRNASPRVLRGHTSQVRHVAFAPDGRSLASAHSDGAVRVWAVELEELIKQAERKAERNLTWEEWQEFFPGEPYRRTFPELPDGDGVVKAHPPSSP